MFLSTITLAEYLCVSPRTIERWRVEGNGPRYMKAGHRVLYNADDVDAWLEAASRRSTSEVSEIGHA